MSLKLVVLLLVAVLVDDWICVRFHADESVAGSLSGFLGGFLCSILSQSFEFFVGREAFKLLSSKSLVSR